VSLIALPRNRATAQKLPTFQAASFSQRFGTTPALVNLVEWQGSLAEGVAHGRRGRITPMSFL
jgi:hypothetical protein